MNMRDARIAYFPNHPSLMAPSDRRRFVHYAKIRGIKFDTIGLNCKEKYDIVILNQKADLSQWSRELRGTTKIIYDAVDSYVSQDASTFKGMMRGTWKFVTGQSRRWQFDYQRAVLDMCCRADAVVCSTDAQKVAISEKNRNVHIILDAQDDDFTEVKKDYACGSPFNFVWEGLASSGIPLEMLREILEPISVRRPIAIHLLTNLVYNRFGDIFYKCSTADEVKKKCGKFSSNIYLYQWSPFALSHVATAADLALIPLDLENTLQRGKPENKLLFFWRIAVPTITSATPAYDAAMARAGLNMTCGTVKEWREMIEKFMTDQSARQSAALQGRAVASSTYSQDEMMRRWDVVFKSIWESEENAETDRATRDSKSLLDIKS